MNRDVLSAEAIKSFIIKNVSCAVNVFDSIDSTNTEAKRAVTGGFMNDAIFITSEQTAGRGRRGKCFYSPKEKGLYFSVVLHPHIQLEDATGITAAAAVCVVETLREETKKHPKIKWVNDIFIDNKKVCGILTEAVTDFESGKVEAVIVGIGINLTTEVFPDEIKDIAVSLGTSIDRNRFAAKIYNRLKEICDKLPNRDFMEDYRKYSLVLGKEITFSRNGKDHTAKAETILDSGELEVITTDGERILLNSGEISIKLY